MCGDGVDSDCDGFGGPDDDEDADGLTWSEEDVLGRSDCDPTDGEVQDTGDTSAPRTPRVDPEPLCGCASTVPVNGLLAALLLVVARRR